MNNLALSESRISTMSQEHIDRVRRLELVASNETQVNVNTRHLIHAGMYARTVMIPAGVMATGTLIKRATTLIISGDVMVFVESGILNLTGYNVIAASANRKQAVLASTDTYMTMIFPTDADSIAQAESEFTDEIDLLMTNHGSEQSFIITGE